MPSLPDAIVPLLSPFASLFDARTWRKAQRLLIGAVLAPGRRTVCACRQAEPDFALSTRCSTGPAGPPWRPADNCWPCCCATWTRAVPWCLAWTRPSSGVRDRALKPRGCTGMRCAPRTATSSRPWACVGSA